MDHVEHLLGLAFRGGRLIAGEEPVDVEIHNKKIRLLLLAEDAAPATGRRAKSMAEEGACLLITLPYSKDQLGKVTGRSACAIAGITDLGLALAVAQKLQEADPAFSSTVEQLQRKQQRALERKEHPRDRSRKKTEEAVPAQAEKKKPFRHKVVKAAADRSSPRDRFKNARPVHKGKGSHTGKQH